MQVLFTYKGIEQSNKKTFHVKVFPVHRVPVVNIKIYGISIVNEEILKNYPHSLFVINYDQLFQQLFINSIDRYSFAKSAITDERRNK